MVTSDAVLAVLQMINDPEMPISIVDLGMVHAVRIADQPAGRVQVDILPTFVGCPALPVIEQEIRKRVGALPGVAGLEVRFLFDPPWSVDRINERGRESLRQIGITVPLAVDADRSDAAPFCPFCGASAVHLESAFGPTRCRMIYYCESCRNSFEHMKRIHINPPRQP